MKSSSARLALGRISFVILIVCGVAVILLNLLLNQSFTKLRSDLNMQTASRQRAEVALLSTRNELAAATHAFDQTKDALEKAVIDREAALKDAKAQSRRAEEADRALVEARQTLDRVQTRLAQYEAAGLSPEQVMAAGTHIKALENELAKQASQNEKLVAQLESFLDHCPHLTNVVFLPAGMRARVVATDPKWNFVVFDAGRDQGVSSRGQLLISRNGKLVGKAVVSRVEKDRAIANVVTGWNLGDIMEGDLLIPADPGT